ncbi:DNA alkylation repair protein [Candidatus Wolfebacteria bacterium]|nr:DNA alkylation repair protein [Candidatus Wolfebacteria bacterium]
MDRASDIKKSLRGFANKEKAKILARFFKTGKGEYGNSDIFLGVMVPQQRKIAAEFKNLSFQEIKKLLKSKIHEERLTGLIILVNQYKSGNEILREKNFKFYLKNISCVNNWDLVDLSCRDIAGNYLISCSEKNRKILYKLAKSKNLWHRRIAIVSTWAFIRIGDFKDALKISEMLLSDKHDLAHKAIGWMLREVGKKDEPTLRKFLNKNVSKMPRTTLRYAIERFSEKDRKKYLIM